MSSVDVQRIAAYGVLRDSANRLLLCRLSLQGDLHGRWTLPGGGIDFGEHPEHAAVREIREETGLEVRLTGLLKVDSEVYHSSTGRAQAIRVIYHAEVVGGALRAETDGSTDMCRWFTPEELESLPMVSLARLATTL